MQKILLLMITVCLLVPLTSCQSVYITPPTPETTVSPEIDLEDEYFTTGNVYQYDMWMPEDGNYYNGSWYYPETRRYRVVKTNALGQTTSSSTLSYTFIVKYNAATGTVSSACLDPACRHSEESGCIMISRSNGYTDMYIERIAEDWMMLKKYQYDSTLGSYYELIAYNLKTGESAVVYSEKFENMIKIDWSGGTAYGNKLYMTKHILDYSKTDFNAEGKTKLETYTPTTRSFAYEYDLDKKTHTELFELPEGWGIKAFSNKRLLVIEDTGKYYTCNFDGTNMVKTDVLDFSPQNMVGTYAYDYIEDGFKLYDLKTNTQKTVTVDEFALYRDCIITDSGVMYNTFTTIDEWNEMKAGREAYIAEHGSNSAMQYQKMCDAVMYKGTSQLWQSDHEGNGLKLVFEKENANIRYLFGNDRYVYCYVKYGSGSTSENKGRSVIDLETGEIISIPSLDIFLGENYQLVVEEDSEE